MTHHRSSGLRKFLTNWGAVVILFFLFIGSWSAQFIAQVAEEKQVAEQHNQVFSMNEIWPKFWSATFENWQSEWLQLFTQALLISGFSAYLFRKEDEEHYNTQQKIDALSAKLSSEK